MAYYWRHPSTFSLASFHSSHPQFTFKNHSFTTIQTIPFLSVQLKTIREMDTAYWQILFYIY